MFHHSSSRNHRSKGSNIKRILQVVVLLAVACWLIYQVKHSRDKKTEYTVNDGIKPVKLGEEIYLGRKGDAGSENVVIIDTNTKGSDESTELKQDEVQHDASLLNNEDNSKEISHSHELSDSQESKPEQHAQSHADTGEEMLHLPSEKEGDNSSDQSGNSNEGSHLKDSEKPEDVKRDLVVDDSVEATMAGEETPSSSEDRTDNSNNGGKENEEASGGDSGSQEVPVDDEASKGKGVEIDEHAVVDVRTDDAHVSSSQGDEASTKDQADNALTAESQSYTDHEPKATGLENVDSDKEAYKEGEVETQLGNVSDVENTDNNSSDETKTDHESENVIENSSTDAESQNFSDTSGDVSVESQAEKASEQVSSSEANDNEVVELQANNESAGESENSQNNSLESKTETANPEKEITAESQGNDGGKSDENLHDVNKKEGSTAKEGKNEAVLTNEAVTASEVSEKTSSDDMTNEIPASEAVQAEGGSNSEAANTNGSHNSEAKDEQSFDMEKQKGEEAAEQKAVQ